MVKKVEGYYYGTGKRKTAVARVFLKEGKGIIKINNVSSVKYFNSPALYNEAVSPLKIVFPDGLKKYDIKVTVKGGGINGQAGAISLGLARSLLQINPDLKSELRKYDFVTRDSRIVERKKVGLHKARKRPQYSKR